MVPSTVSLTRRPKILKFYIRGSFADLTNIDPVVSKKIIAVVDLSTGLDKTLPMTRLKALSLLRLIRP
ncbi:MAG: hypothetical protein COA41_13150 [Sphingopyxis sp.]|nr:MAG: hypothetical protein COA41_13150 [Sphingopyxis sp.]